MKARKINLLIVLFFLPFLFLNTLTNDTRGGSIDPNNPTVLPGSGQNYYTSWNPENKSDYYQVEVSNSGWYLLGFNSSQYLGSLKFSIQSDYSTTEFQHPTIDGWRDGFVLWDHDENVDKFINFSRESQTVFGSGEYSAHIRKSEAISFYTFYEDSINKIKYRAYTRGGDVLMNYYLGFYFYEVQLIGGHTYEIGYDISTSGSENVGISIIVFKESGGYLYGSIGGDNAEAWSGANVAKLSSFQPSITATYLIVSYQYPSNEFIPSEFHIYDTSENLWEDLTTTIPGYAILILGLVSISTIFLLIKKSKS